MSKKQATNKGVEKRLDKLRSLFPAVEMTIGLDHEGLWNVSYNGYGDGSVAVKLYNMDSFTDLVKELETLVEREIEALPKRRDLKK